MGRWNGCMEKVGWMGVVVGVVGFLWDGCGLVSVCGRVE
jgi:hypothetical protein